VSKPEKRPYTRRKPIPPTRSRDLTVRLTEAEYAKLETLASVNGATISDFVREQAIAIPWSRLPGTGHATTR